MFVFREELSELNSKIDDAKEIENLMSTDFKNILGLLNKLMNFEIIYGNFVKFYFFLYISDREFEQNRQHKEKMTKRKNDLETLYKDMETAKSLNTKLASDYRTLQVFTYLVIYSFFFSIMYLLLQRIGRLKTILSVFVIII